MDDTAGRRGKLIRDLEEAMLTAEEIGEVATDHLIERAIGEARAQQFRPPASA